jgi:hypothetical protein
MRQSRNSGTSHEASAERIAAHAFVIDIFSPVQYSTASSTLPHRFRIAGGFTHKDPYATL